MQLLPKCARRLPARDPESARMFRLAPAGWRSKIFGSGLPLLPSLGAPAIQRVRLLFVLPPKRSCVHRRAHTPTIASRHPTLVPESQSGSVAVTALTQHSADSSI